MLVTSVEEDRALLAVEPVPVVVAGEVSQRERRGPLGGRPLVPKVVDLDVVPPLLAVVRAAALAVVRGP